MMIRLLFIDDDPKAQQTLSLVLEEEYKVYSAYTGLSGIELVEEIHPDVVLLDINLPDIDGLEILEKINNSSQAPPTIMLTASQIRYRNNKLKGERSYKLVVRRRRIDIRKVKLLITSYISFLIHIHWIRTS